MENLLVSYENDDKAYANNDRNPLLRFLSLVGDLFDCHNMNNKKQEFFKIPVFVFLCKLQLNLYYQL